jgi:hypothetical protein
MSVPGTYTRPPSEVAFAQLSSTFATRTYPIQFGGAPIFFASSASVITPPNAPQCDDFHIV